MSRVACTCGHIIRDQTDNLPNKATFIKDKDFEQYLDDGQNIVKDAIENIEKGASSQRLHENTCHFNDYVPPTWEAIVDNLMRTYYRYKLDIYECENCGRILIQKANSESFVSFSSESGKYEAILDKNNSDFQNL